MKDHLRRGRAATGAGLTSLAAGMIAALAGLPAAGAVPAAGAALAARAVPASGAGAHAVPAARAVLVTSAQTAGSIGGDLTGVAVLSASNAWAVGDRVGAGPSQTLIEHWNGRSWRRVPSPNPGGSAQPNGLSDITAISAGDMWAVGSYFDGTLDRTLILHWNGRSWRRVPSPTPGCIPGADLFSVAAVSRTNVWAVGQATECFSLTGVPLIERWNGRSWKVARAAETNGFLGGLLDGVAATSARNAWAVGLMSNGSSDRTLIQHWNGKSWKRVPSPNPTASPLNDQLRDVTAVSARNAWAVGSADVSSPSKGNVSVIEHWNGTSWKRVRSPNPGERSNVLIGVTAVSARLAWAVGVSVDSTRGRTLIERWNGTSWRRVSSSNPGLSRHDDTLFGVAASSGGRAWAVGSIVNGGVASRTLIERWNGRSWVTQG